MTENLVECPYCGNLIDKNEKICPHCKEVFEEREIPVKVNSLGWFLILNFFTLGLFQYVWLFLNINKINQMTFSKKDKLKLGIPLALLICSIFYILLQLVRYGFYLFDIPKLLPTFLWLIGTPVFWAAFVLIYIISYRVLRIIEKYTYNKYNIKIYHSELGWLVSPLIFCIWAPLFYMVYFIYTYKERVYNPKPITM